MIASLTPPRSGLLGEDGRPKIIDEYFRTVDVPDEPMTGTSFHLGTFLVVDEPDLIDYERIARGEAYWRNA